MTRYLTIAGVVVLALTANFILTSPGEGVDLSLAELKSVERYVVGSCSAESLGLGPGTRIRGAAITTYTAKHGLWGVLLRAVLTINGERAHEAQVFRLGRDRSGGLEAKSQLGEFAWALADYL